ncbi:T9SS type A sorting domain-containing protein [Aquimarina sp. 2201CG5-10]|uniref:T9SS type A sorting domain-containing protein n=1 Tax=Aquimarina callyspongiae TaxID=3098150 RepID=UPI002AB579FF|nr:T9SS type A sorting domain-containing protein [Aquimarina sp. 2201CG5-10]MDY8134566.1 T9SS type A sorting domain-containing protein [Aquimarina sp. 2201CG5-10]
MKKIILILVTILCAIQITMAQCGPGEDTEAPAPILENGTLERPFTNLLSSYVGSVPSGTYYFKFNGSTFQGVLDNDTDGGGWLMILNYVHLAGDNSELQVRNTDLPLLGSSSLGDNESGTSNWGHLGNQLAATLDFEEMRFYGVSTGHARVINFKTDYANALNYIKTGSGSFSGFDTPANFTALEEHSANIPEDTGSFFSNQGDLALTSFPFYKHSNFHWGIRGFGSRWEVDDYALNAESTIHRVWVRGDLSPAPPTASISITRNLDASGNLTIAATDFGVTFTDNCGNVNQSVSQTDFTCANLGTNIVQLIGTDDQGNSISVDVTLVIENTPPVITTDSSTITLTLDSMNPSVSITPADLNASAEDECEVQSFEITSQTEFTCADIGSNTVILTAIDNLGQTSTAEVTLVIEDTPPVITTDPSIIILNLDSMNPSVSISPEDLNASAIDDCGLQSFEITSQTEFTCADLGSHTVTLTAIDDLGQTTTAEATIFIRDNESPVAIGKDITVQLDASGSVTISGTDVDNGSTDNCNLIYSVDKDTFYCDDIGSNMVTLTVTDNDDNTDTAVVTVTVEDILGPVFNPSTLPGDQEVVANNGDVYIVTNFTAEATAIDNCEPRKKATNITQNPVVGTELSIGDHIITLTASDNNNNNTIHTFTLTVSPVLSVRDLQFESQLQVYPVPVREMVTISSSQELIDNIVLIDLSGRIIKKTDQKRVNNYQMNTADLASGVYFLKITSGNKEAIKRITKN